MLEQTSLLLLGWLSLSQQEYEGIQIYLLGHKDYNICIFPTKFSWLIITTDNSETFKKYYITVLYL